MSYADAIGSRLVTQNLLVSAASADVASTPDWTSIQDLAVLIDMFCLYDRIVVLGREVNAVLEPQSSPLTRLIQTSGVLSVESPQDREVDLIAKAAKHHLLTYLGEKDLGDFDGLIRKALRPDEATYGLCHSPDGSAVLEEGQAWLRDVPRRSEVLRQLEREDGMSRSYTFVIRSFLYVGYSDVTGLPFIPDSTRAGLITNFVAAERSFRAKLLNKVAVSSREVLEITHPELSRLSPFAATVFERTAHRRELAEQIDLIRSELAPLRRRLRKAEARWQLGKGDEVVKAAAEWRLVTDELGRSYGREASLVSLEQILAFGSPVGELADAPYKSKAWVNFLLGLPFDAIRRILLRRPVIELHRLRRDRPGSARLAATIHRLFGTHLS